MDLITAYHEYTIVVHNVVMKYTVSQKKLDPYYVLK